MKKLVAALAVSLFPALSLAAFPDRPIKLIVPWGAGGDTDVIYRTFAPLMQKYLGGTIVVANVGGASGTKGAKEAKDSPADGYTIFAIHDSIHSTYYTGVADVNYTDFEPLCLVSSTPSIVTASPKTPWNDMKSLLADAKARPGQITVGATLGSTSHFFPALVAKAAGIQFKYVSYEGTAPRMNALLGGHIDLAESNLTQKGKADAGQLKFLAIASNARHPELPSVPTLKELGVDVEYAVNRGLVAPKGTPADVLAKLRSACGAAARETGLADALKKHGTLVRYLDEIAYARFFQTNDAESKEVAKDLGMLKR
ncbi:MAG TPA: tripartite tricarboxylate transporter substrate binding protein [Burkholderiales bacterium]|nr:tripartite tricarboxylate transporter substrate binding protein [Burkholderiales bacterium]